MQSSVKTVKTSAPSAPKSALVDTARVSSVLASAPESVPKNIGANVGADSDIPKNVTQRDLQGFGADGPDDFLHLAEVCKLVSKFTDVERQKLIEFLTQSQPLPQKITPEDAQKMRDIALVWWPEYYPEQMQALLTQMYAWQAPGTKYNVAIIAEWLQGEDDLIRDRITELMHRRRD